MDTFDNSELAKTMKDEFVDCVKHHQMILEFSKQIEDLFRWFLFSKIFYSGKQIILLLKNFSHVTSSGLLVCLIAYVLSTIDEFSVIKLMNLLSYFMLSTSEILLFGYVSELLKRHVSQKHFFDRIFLHRTSSRVLELARL